MQVRDCKESKLASIRNNGKNQVKPIGKNAKLFKLLRGEMVANDLENKDIASLIDRTPMHVSRCLCGKAEFNLSEQYKIMKLINRPYEDLYLIFPENGVDIKEGSVNEKVILSI